MNGKKEYSIKINGVEVSIKSVTKLEDAVNSLDKAIINTGKTSATLTKSATTRTKALTDEEKAAKKLADTQRKITEVNNEANRAQIEATKQLRERTREVTREISINQLAEGSIKALGMQLTDLRNSYEELSEEERINADVGGKMLTQIQALDEKYKALRESTGNYRDSVGNYDKALKGLTKLDNALGKLDNTNTGLQSGFIASNSVLNIFGNVSEGVSVAQQELAKILAIVTIAQQLGNVATKEGIIATTASAAADSVKSVQLRAKAISESLATKNTIAATIAQKAFNAVAYANPYVLLALALVAVVAALATFSRSTNKAADDTENYVEAMDGVKFATQEAADAHDEIIRKIRDVQLEIDVANGKISQYSADLIKIANSTKDALHESNKTLITDIDEIEKKYKSFGFVLKDIFSTGDNWVEREQRKLAEIAKVIADNAVRVKDLKDKQAKEEELRIQEEINREKEKTDELNKKNAEDAKQRAEELKRLSAERAALELEALRSLEDTKIKLIVDSYEQQKQTVLKNYSREVEDLKNRLKTEENLTLKARKYLNDQIVLLAEVRNKEIDQIDKERTAAELDTLRELENQRNDLILSQLEKRRGSTLLNYDRQIEDSKKRLDEEFSLTESQRQEINEMIVNFEKQKSRELEAIAREESQRRANVELQIVEESLREAQHKIGEVTVKNGGGIWKGVIDVEATRKNLASSNAALEDYINGISGYQEKLKTIHESTLLSLEKGTIEYEEEIQKYIQANNDATKKIKEAQQKQAENTRNSTDLQIGYFKSLVEKVSEYADLAAQAVTGVFDTWNMGLQASLDSLYDSLENINEHYENAKDQRERYAEDVESIEERLRTATGGTAEALRTQLIGAMHLREEAARDEVRLQKEKEKREAEIAKKEKQMKRNELIGNIAVGIANTAQGITKALTLVWPLNLVMAALVGALGTVQVGIMGRQLSKLAKGGEINGPSHSSGGVKISGTNIEVEGGEFVTNKSTYSKNKGLIQYINSQDRQLSAKDLSTFFSNPGPVESLAGDYLATGGEVPIIENYNSSNLNYDELAEAFSYVKFEPKVAVTDIMDATDEVVTVRDLSDF